MLNYNDVVKSLVEHLSKKPAIGTNVYIARTAVVIGDVEIEDEASIWYNAVLRGDIQKIHIGKRTNVQDNAVVHVTDKLPCKIGSSCTIGHGAIVHACTIEDEVLIGMGAIVLDGAIIGSGSIIGAQAIVTAGTLIPPNSLVMGVPARIVRELSEEERSLIKTLAQHYVYNAAWCLKNKIEVHPLCQYAKNEND